MEPTPHEAVPPAVLVGPEPTALRPLYMWAGGKRKLLKSYRPLWPDLTEVDHYVEPFFGAGAVFGWLHGEWAVTGRGPLAASIGDVNAELMGLLEEVRDHPGRFIADVSALGQEFLAVSGKTSRKQWYYALRAAYWADASPAALYVLMRLGFNGIWQTCAASDGKFATPAGLLTQTRLDQIVDKELVAAWAGALRSVAIHTGSYATIQVPLDGNVLIYLDPPYRHSFTDYGTGFDDEDQRDLMAWAAAQADAGCTVVLANRTSTVDTFFQDHLDGLADITTIDVTYTAGRRKKTADGYEAKAAQEILAIFTPDADARRRRLQRTAARKRVERNMTKPG